MAYELKKYRSLEQLIDSTNICDLLDDTDLTHIGNCAMEGYKQDDNTRADWKKRSRRAMELALQVPSEKTFPWQHASNVKIPLITIAALQFSALAYPQIIDSPDLVKCMVYGTDPDGSKNARADRIAAHMSWQNLEQDTGWEEAHDKGLFALAIIGNVFIKKIYDPACKGQVTQLVLPSNFVTNYYTRSVETSPRYTHTFNLTANDIRTRELDGRFRKTPDGEPLPKTIPAIVGPDEEKIAQDKRQGITEPPESEVTPYFTGEQYCWWDLDGDGYEEPYIVTFDIGTGFVRRIVARFRPSCVTLLDGSKLNEQDAYLSQKNPVYEICPINIFTKLTFEPSPDGGFYDIGLGQLLGDINEAVNTTANQLIDAGTMSTLGGGFLGRGFKNRAGPFSMRPFEWYPVDAPGDDLRKNILPLPIREPSPVLMQMMQYLVSFAERITQTTEIGMGENPDQNTPAQTTQTLDANGRRMMNAIFKRVWRGFRDEYRVQYELNRLHLSGSAEYVDLSSGQGAFITEADYTGPSEQIKPAADPFIVSDVLKQQTNDRLIAMSNNLPGFNKYQTTLRTLKGMKVQAIEQIYPPLPMDPQTRKPMVDFPPQPNIEMLKLEIEKAKLGIEQQKLQVATFEAQVAQQEAQADVMMTMLEVKTKAMDLDKSIAEAERLRAQAALYIAQAGSEQAEPYIKLIYAQIEDVAQKRNTMMQAMQTMVDARIEKMRIKADLAKANAEVGPDGKKKNADINLPEVVQPSDAIAQSIGMTKVH